MFRFAVRSSRPTAVVHRPRLEILEDRCLLSAGDLDPTFGTGGLVISGVTAAGDSAKDLVVLPDGKILTAGGANGDFALVRFNANGSRDTSFGTGGVVTTDFSRLNDGIQAVVLQTDGKIVAAGRSYGQKGFNFDSQLSLARYLPTGALDTSFGSKGKVLMDLGTGSTDGIYAVALQSDGKIVVAGETNSFSGGNNFLVARYTANGKLDATFGNGGVVSTDFGGADQARDLAIQSDGKIVVVGWVTPYNGDGPDTFALARYNPNGSLDATFGTGGKVTSLFGPPYNGCAAAAVEVLADGRLVVGGTSDLNFAVARYLGNGSLDSTFGTGGVTIINDVPLALFEVNAMAIQPNGRIIVAGTQTIWTPPNPPEVHEYNFGLVRLNADGSLDTAFGGGGSVTTNFVNTFGGTISNDAPYAMGLQADGKIVLAGYTDVLGNGSDLALARYEGDAPQSAASGATAQASASTQTTAAGNSADGLLDLTSARENGTDPTLASWSTWDWALAVAIANEADRKD